MNHMGFGTICIIIFVILLLFASMSGNSSTSTKTTRRTTQTITSNPIRDRDPEFYDQLERQYNDMINKEKNKR